MRWNHCITPTRVGVAMRIVFRSLVQFVCAVSASHITDNSLGSTRELLRKSSIAVLSPRLLGNPTFHFWSPSGLAKTRVGLSNFCKVTLRLIAGGVSSEAASCTCRSCVSTLPSRHHLDDSSRLASEPETAFGRGHRLQLREPLSDGGLSNLREFAIRSIAGGVVDSVQFSLVGNWALGVINLMTKCQTY